MKQNKTQEAIEFVLESTIDSKYGDAFVQLKSELSNWEREDYLGLAPKKAYHLRIKYAVLTLISDIEKKNSKLSNKDKLVHQYEQEINDKLEYLLTLDKGNKIDKILYKVKHSNGKLFDSLKNLSITHDRLSKIAKQGTSSEKIDGILSEIREGIQEIFTKLYEDNSIPSNDVSFSETLLTSDSSYIAKWLAEQNHKKANIDLLLNKITLLENKYKQVKTASFFGVLGFIISNQLNKSNHSIFGEGYDESGYDRNGYDAKGYNKNGYDSEGYNINEYNEMGLSQDNNISEMLNNITPELVDIDTNLDLD